MTCRDFVFVAVNPVRKCTEWEERIPEEIWGHGSPTERIREENVGEQEGN